MALRRELQYRIGLDFALSARPAGLVSAGAV
jgi:hypothetical protein